MTQPNLRGTEEIAQDLAYAISPGSHSAKVAIKSALDLERSITQEKEKEFQALKEDYLKRLEQLAEKEREIERLESELENDESDICEQRNKAEAAARTAESRADKAESVNAILKEKLADQQKKLEECKCQN